MPNTVPAATPVTPNPAALGLVAFGITTVLLSLINAGVLPVGGEPVVIPLALAYGGLMQVIAGLLEVKTGNTFGMTAFLSYGAFWLWFALLLIFAHTGVIDISKAGPTVGVALLLWGVLTLYLWVSTFRLPKILFTIFLTLWVTFALLGLGAVLGQPIIGPESGLEKEYLVRVFGTVTDRKLAQLRFGLPLDGRPLKPAKVMQLGEGRLRFILAEGRKRQIRRMCDLVQLKVAELERIRIGPLALGDLAEGRWRELRPEERRALIKASTAKV